MRVVICGGGVIGACTAYFLSLRQVEVIVVERTGVACAASGKSGGSWRWIGAMAPRSAGSPGAASTCMPSWPPCATAAAGAIAGSTPGVCWRTRGRGVGGGRAVSGPAWLGERALVQGKLGTQATTAQVHPARFTEAMLQAAIGMGAELRLGCVTMSFSTPGAPRHWASRLRTGPCKRSDPGHPGVLPPRDAGRPAAAWAGLGIANAYVATGHSVWGILNAPASGEAMAELILEGTTRHVDLRRFDPARLPAG